jgi:hypothetical protein
LSRLLCGPQCGLRRVPPGMSEKAAPCAERTQWTRQRLAVERSRGARARRPTCSAIVWFTAPSSSAHLRPGGWGLPSATGRMRAQYQRAGGTIRGAGACWRPPRGPREPLRPGRGARLRAAVVLRVATDVAPARPRAVATARPVQASEEMQSAPLPLSRLPRRRPGHAESQPRARRCDDALTILRSVYR